MFLTGFGATGAIGRAYGLAYLTSSILGVLTGLAVGFAGFKLIGFFMHQQASSSIKGSDLVGLLGEVSVAIPAGGIGQVGLVVRARRHYASARTLSGGALEEGTSIRVLSSTGSQVVVERA